MDTLSEVQKESCQLFTNYIIQIKKCKLVNKINQNYRKYNNNKNNKNNKNVN